MMQVSRDIVFDEMSCWYELAKVTEDADVGNGNAVVKCRAIIKKTEWI